MSKYSEKFHEGFKAARRHLKKEYPQLDIDDPGWSLRTITRVQFMNGVKFTLRRQIQEQSKSNHDTEDGK